MPGFGPGIFIYCVKSFNTTILFQTKLKKRKFYNYQAKHRLCIFGITLQPTYGAKNLYTYFIVTFCSRV